MKTDITTHNRARTHLEFQIHQIDSSGSTAYEEDLHDGVVERDKAGEEVQVPGHEHHQEQDLRLAGHQGAAPCLPDLAGEKEYGEKVRQVSEKPEDIHLDNH